MRKELDQVLAAARRDASMAQYLEDVDRHWSERLFDVAPGRLIRGWDSLTEELDEHSQALLAMREAPISRKLIPHQKCIDDGKSCE